MNTLLETLPALRGLQRLADLRPCVVIDSREQEPLVFRRLSSRRGTLQTADYSLAGFETEVGIERKTLDDLAACCVGENRLRFFRELGRLRGFRFARLLIIGEREAIMGKRYRSHIEAKAVLATLAVVEARFGVPVVHATNPSEAAEMIERWAWWYAREAVERCNELLRATEREGAPSPSDDEMHAATATGGATNERASS